MEAARIRGRRRRLQSRDDGLDKLATTTEASAEEYEPEVSTTTMEASKEEAEERTRPSESLQQWRRRYVYRLMVFAMTPAASTL